MLEIPDAIALTGVFSVIITAMIKYVPTKTNGVPKDVCSEKHRNIDIRLSSIETKLDSIDQFLRGRR